MLTEFDFNLLQLRYVQAAANKIPTFRPDGLTPAAIGAVVTAASGVRQVYIDTRNDFDLGRGSYRQAVNDGHDAAIGVFAAMKSRYRKDAATLDTISGLPVDDQSAADTTKRMDQTTSLWGKLPLIGTPAAQFVAWAGMAKTDFDSLLTSMATKQAGLPDKDQAFQVAEGNLHDTNADVADLVTAALAQGRAQFPSGASREVIDAIPTVPATQAPSQAVISQATSPGAGKAHLVFDANHGTSFDVLMKAPGAATFTKVVDDAVEKTYDATGLTAGLYQFEVIGRNSLGDGAASAAVSVTVA
jgi:hypothetical protein